MSAWLLDARLTALGSVFKGMTNKWYVDELYQAIIITPKIRHLCL